jgi:thioredoxin 1
MAAVIAVIPAAVLFTSCSSRDGLLDTDSSMGQFETYIGVSKIMNTMKTTSKVEHIGESEFNEKVLRSATPVLVDFYADWCGPCKALARVLEEFARENPGAKIVKVNVDENFNLAMQYGIESIPSLLVFKDSELAARHMGFADKAALKRLITR